MRVITSLRTACCLVLLAVPAGSAQLDNATGVQASREVGTVPPPAPASRPTARNRTARAARPGSSRSKAAPH